MNPRNKGLWALGVTFMLNALLIFFRDFDPGNVKAFWLIWAGLSWNYFAYAFDRDMWPRTFVELDGDGKGKPGYRTFYFWGTLLVHLAFLATMAFADK